jgi:hypothetical protein
MACKGSDATLAEGQWHLASYGPSTDAPLLGIGSRDPSAIEVTAPAPAVRLGPELPLQLHQAPDPGAIGAEVRLDVGGQPADGGQVDAEQLRAPLQRRRDRPAQVRVVPGPHRIRLSNTSSRVDQQRCVVRQGRSAPGWAALGPQFSGTWDNRGQQETANAEVSGRSERLTWAAKPLE